MKKFVIYIILISLFLAGCLDNPWRPKQITDPDLVGSENCLPPCWEGILPGITTFDETISLVDKFGNKEKDNIELLKGQTLRIIRNGDSNVYIDFIDDLVLSIQFYVEKTDIGSFVAHFGEPDGYFLFLDEPPLICGTFEDDGIVFCGHLSEEYMIDQKIRVNTVVYLAPQYFDIHLEKYNVNRDMNDKYFEWEGFGICPEIYFCE